MNLILIPVVKTNKASQCTDVYLYIVIKEIHKCNCKLSKRLV